MIDDEETIVVKVEVLAHLVTIARHALYTDDMTNLDADSLDAVYRFWALERERRYA